MIQTRRYDLLAIVALSLAVLTNDPRPVEADDKAFELESKFRVAAATQAEGTTKQSMDSESRANMPTKQNPWPNHNGFISPTLDGPWRFRLALDAWLPLVMPVTLEDKKKNLYTGWLLNNLEFYMPIDAQVRKGSFGAYWHTIGFIFDGDVRVGRRGRLDWDTGGFLMDVGLSYEIGRWALGKRASAPNLTVEPTFGARLTYFPLDIELERLGRSADGDFSSYVPVIGVRTFWDLSEHWNLYIAGDYGGFGVDDNRQTWQGLALIGYRWRGLGIGWNLQAGYRAMRFFDLKKKEFNARMDAHGPNVVLSIEF